MHTFSRHFTKHTISISSRHFYSLQHQHQPISLPQINFPSFSQHQQQHEQQKLLEHQLISLLHGCTHLTQIKQIHAHIIRKHLHQCSFVLTKLIRMLANLNIPTHPYPRIIFKQVQHPSPFLYTALIRAYSLFNPLSDTVSLYTQMRYDGIRPLSFTFSALIKACSETLNVELGQQVHAQIISVGGFVSDLYVGNTLIDMYVKCGFLNCGRRLFDEMPERDVISWTSLIVAYTKNADMKQAAQLFDGLPEKDMVAWTAMVTGYAQNAKPREALMLFRNMRNARVQTDEVTLTGAISACAQLGVAKEAKWVSEVAERDGLSPSRNVVVGSAMIDMYSKCGSVDEAYRVFECMKERNVYSYSAMIVGFAMHGKVDEAMKLFYDMVKTEVKPNRVTFIGVLTACSHSGMVEQGRHLFGSMQKDYGITPDGDHYACMVDVLARSGHLKEALDLAKTMPIKPNAGVWGALLGACRIHGNPDIAEVAANHLFELEPDDIGNYVLLCNIYAVAGKWVDVSRVRKLMRTRGLKKNPACSWVEGKDGNIHEFFAGDMTHPKTKEIKKALDELLETLRLHGYKPKLNAVGYALSNEEKEQILKSHSEKLALSFSLLATSDGSAIRIVKNLRVCEDCHIVMCYASRITRREIVLRDSLRFHHFRDGVCSCGDFW